MTHWLFFLSLTIFFIHSLEMSTSGLASIKHSRILNTPILLYLHPFCDDQKFIFKGVPNYQGTCSTCISVTFSSPRLVVVHMFLFIVFMKFLDSSLQQVSVGGSLGVFPFPPPAWVVVWSGNHVLAGYFSSSDLCWCYGVSSCVWCWENFNALPGFISL